MIDRIHFYEQYKKLFGKLTQEKVNGLNFLLDMLEVKLGTELLNNIQQFAYVLATIKHETADTYRPIREYLASKKAQPKLWARQLQYAPYTGRGYCQLTWKENYVRMTWELRKFNSIYENIDLVKNPEKALDPEIALDIMLIGMDKGIFGADIDKYINNQIVDYKGARRTINIQDKAQFIADYAKRFELCLNCIK